MFPVSKGFVSVNSILIASKSTQFWSYNMNTYSMWLKIVREKNKRRKRRNKRCLYGRRPLQTSQTPSFKVMKLAWHPGSYQSTITPPIGGSNYDIIPYPYLELMTTWFPICHGAYQPEFSICFFLCLPIAFWNFYQGFVFFNKSIFILTNFRPHLHKVSSLW